MEILVVILLAMAAGLGTTAVLRDKFGVTQNRVTTQTAAQKKRVRERKREQRIEQGLRQRSELGEKLSKIVSNIIPASGKEIAQAREDLSRAGLKMSSTAFWALRIAFVAGSIVFSGIIANALFPNDSLKSLLMLTLGVIGGLILPQLYLIDARNKWRAEIERQLPNALDLMSVSVSAGATLEAAIRTVAENSEGALADALAHVSAQTQYMDVTEALAQLSDRAGVQPLTIFTASLIQARKGGLALADILKLQAETVREYRRQKIEEEINKLPIKIIFPIIFFIFPALFGVVLVPAGFKLIAALGGM